MRRCASGDGIAMARARGLSLKGRRTIGLAHSSRGDLDLGRMRSTAFWLPLLLFSLVVGPACLYLAVVSAGMGHGSYTAALMFFPFTMLSTRLFGSITAPFALLAIIQFPIYGFILGSATAKGRLVRTMLLLLLVHALTIGISWGANSYKSRNYVFLDAVRAGDTQTVRRMLTTAWIRTPSPTPVISLHWSWHALAGRLKPQNSSSIAEPTSIIRTEIFVTHH